MGEEVVEVGRIVGKGDRGGGVRHGQGRLSSDLLPDFTDVFSSLNYFMKIITLHFICPRG